MQERHLGEMEGATYQTMRKLGDEQGIGSRYEEIECEGGETKAQMEARLRKFLLKLAEKAQTLEV